MSVKTDVTLPYNTNAQTPDVMKASVDTKKQPVLCVI